MGWVALSEGFSEIQKIDNEGNEGNPLTIVKVGFKGLPDTFILESVLMVGW
jgi:hypothetical protein